MKSFHISQFFSLTISLALLVAPLPISAIGKEIINIPIEKKELSNDLYIYLGKELSDIGNVIARIKDLDDNHKSAIHELHAYIEEGFFLGRYESVLEALEQAEITLQRNGHTLNHDQLDSLVTDFDFLANKILNGELNIDSQLLDTISLPSLEDANGMITRASCPRTLMVSEHMDVLCKTTLRKHLNTKQGAHIQGKLKVGKKAKFKDKVTFKDDVKFEDNVIIEGSLSVTDLVVASCMDSLCVNTLSVNDIIITGMSCLDDLCIENLSVIDASVSGTLSVNDAYIVNGTIDNFTVTTTILDQIVNELTVAVVLSAADAVVQNLQVTNISVTDQTVTGTLSVNNQIVTNLTATNISATDAVVQNLQVTNISVTDQTVTGTLSVNNQIVTNLTATNISATDAVVQNLQVTNISVTDQTVTGTLSVNNQIVNNLTTTNVSATDAVVQNLQVTNVSVTDQTVTGTLSVNNQIVNNLTTTNVSATDAVVQNLQVTNVSVTDQTVTGTLSVNNQIVTNLTTTNVSATDAVVQNLQVTNVSVTDQTVTGTLSVNNQIVTNLTTTNVSATDAVVQNLQVTNVSVTDQTVTGTLSVNNQVITGNLTVPAFTPAGVIHNSAAGLLSSSLIINADVAVGAGIVDTKLATISTAGKVSNSATTATSANTINAIVQRNGSGNFTTNMITLNGTTTNATDAATKAYVDSQVGSSGTSANTPDTLVLRNNTGRFSAGAISVTDAVASNSLTVTPFGTAGIVHNNAAGLLSSSLIVNADVAPGAGIVDTKLATISTAGKVANSATTATTVNGTPNAIVLRDGSGRFETETVRLNAEGNMNNGGWISQQGAAGFGNIIEAQYIVTRDCIVTKMYAACVNPPTGGAFTFTLYIDGAPTALQTVITDPNTSANTTGASISVSAGQKISVRTQLTATTTAAIASLELRY